LSSSIFALISNILAAALQCQHITMMLMRQRQATTLLRGARHSSSKAARHHLDLVSDKLFTPFMNRCYAFVGGNMCLQWLFGESKSFFNGSFITNKDPDDLAEFYQAEELLKIIAIHPILFEFFMNKVEPDENEATEETCLLTPDETHFMVRGLGMDVSFEILQEEDEDDDGEARLKSFVRHERFIDYVPLLNDIGIKMSLNGEEWLNFALKIPLWDQIWNYGFKRLPNGTTRVYHHGEYFAGPWPVRIVVFFHQYYVLWACEKFINGDAFGTEDLDRQQEQMANMPLHVFKEFLAKVRAKEEKALEHLLIQAEPDSSAIAKTESTIHKLNMLSLRNTSTIKVAKRQGSVAAHSKSPFKIIGQGSDTMEVLASVMQDAEGSNKQVLNAAVKQAMQHPDLEFKDRATLRRSTSIALGTVQPKTEVINAETETINARHLPTAFKAATRNISEMKPSNPMLVEQEMQEMAKRQASVLGEQKDSQMLASTAGEQQIELARQQATGVAQRMLERAGQAEMREMARRQAVLTAENILQGAAPAS